MDEIYSLDSLYLISILVPLAAKIIPFKQMFCIFSEHISQLPPSKLMPLFRLANYFRKNIDCIDFFFNI